MAALSKSEALGQVLLLALTHQTASQFALFFTMPSPTRAELRAAFAKAQQRVVGHPYIEESDAWAIRVAVEVVLGDPSRDGPRQPLGAARLRAQFLALADAIEGGD